MRDKTDLFHRSDMSTDLPQHLDVDNINPREVDGGTVTTTTENRDGTFSVTQRTFDNDNLTGDAYRVETAHYNENGDLLSGRISEYDEGNKTFETGYNANQDVVSAKEYDGEGNVTQTALFNPDTGAPTEAREFSPDGAMTREETYHPITEEITKAGNFEDGNLTSVDRYDSEGNQVTSEKFDEDGKLDKMEVYDKYEDLLYTVSYEDGEVDSIETADGDQITGEEMETLYNDIMSDIAETLEGVTDGDEDGGVGGGALEAEQDLADQEDNDSITSSLDDDPID